MYEQALMQYVEWWSLLYAWARALLAPDVAQRLASQAMANMFLRACRGAESDDGPWVASADELYVLAGRDLSLSADGACMSLIATLPVPCDIQLYEMARLYAAAYHAAYSAQLSLHQREHMALLITMWKPHVMSDDEVTASLETILSRAHPLRCVLEAWQGHTHDGELICEASSTLWQGEHLRGRRWLREGSVRKVGA